MSQPYRELHFVEIRREVEASMHHWNFSNNQSVRQSVRQSLQLSTHPVIYQSYRRELTCGIKDAWLRYSKQLSAFQSILVSLLLHIQIKCVKIVTLLVESVILVIWVCWYIIYQNLKSLAMESKNQEKSSLYSVIHKQVSLNNKVLQLQKYISFYLHTNYN